jgi:hypothetical protein
LSLEFVLASTLEQVSLVGLAMATLDYAVPELHRPYTVT